MRVVILNTQVPFIQGGAEYLADTLMLKVQEYGHQAEIVRIPFKWYPLDTLLKHTLACRFLSLEQARPDLVIALKFPVYYVPFGNKKIWLLHQYRQVYDLWDTSFRGLPDTAESYRVRDMIVNADNRYLREVDEIYTISQNVASRLKKYNELDAQVLYPPLLHPERFLAGNFENYFFYPSRIGDAKRQMVAIEAMRYIRSDFKLILAGAPDTDAYGQRIQDYISRHRLEKRVELRGWISEEEKAALMANACGVIFIPIDEDYGYVTIEALTAHKPVITFTDSGGPTEFIVHDENGLVLDPDATALAEGMEYLYSNRSRTAEMGEQAFKTLETSKISWNYVIESLLG
jgi:glycosyltransferase involved in cell wall biosynthesis